MAVTRTKIKMPNGEAAIQIDGFDTAPIYLKVVKDSSGPVDGGINGFNLKAHAQELDSNGDEIVGSIGPIFSGTRDPVAVIDPAGILKEEQHVRREAVKAFLTMRKISSETIPDNLSDVEGEV